MFLNNNDIKTPPKDSTQTANNSLDPYLLLIFAVAIRYSVHTSSFNGQKLNKLMTTAEMDKLFRILENNKALVFLADEETPRKISGGIKTSEESTLLGKAHNYFKEILEPCNLTKDEIKCILPSIIQSGELPSLTDLIFMQIKELNLAEPMIEKAVRSGVVSKKTDTSELEVGKIALNKALIEKFNQLQSPPQPIQITSYATEDFDQFLFVVLKVRQQAELKAKRENASIDFSKKTTADLDSAKIRDHSGKNLLGLAAALGTPEVFERVYRDTTKNLGVSWKGADNKDESEDEGNEAGHTPFHIALKNNNIALCDYFFTKAGSINPTGYIPNIHAVSSRDKETLLHIAAEKNNITAVKKLIAKKVKLNEKNSSGETPLRLAVRYKNKEIVTLLLEAGVEVNERDDKGNTALHQAAMADDQELVLLLLQSSADHTLKNNDGKMPVQLATDGEVIGALLSKTPNTASKTSHISSATMITETLTQGHGSREPGTGSPQPQDLDLMDTAIAAIDARQLKLLTEIFKKDKLSQAKLIKATLSNGNTLLHHALHHVITSTMGTPNYDDAVRIIELLINEGADLFKKDAHGKTPLDVIRDNVQSEPLMSIIGRNPLLRLHLSIYQAYLAHTDGIVVTLFLCALLPSGFGAVVGTTIALMLFKSVALPALLAFAPIILGSAALCALVGSIICFTPEKYLGFGLFSNKQPPSSPANGSDKTVAPLKEVPKEVSITLTQEVTTITSEHKLSQSKPSYACVFSKQPHTPNSPYTTELIALLDDLKEALTSHQSKKNVTTLSQNFTTLSQKIDLIINSLKTSSNKLVNCDSSVVEVYTLLNTLNQKYDLMDPQRAGAEPVALVQAQMSSLEVLWNKHHTKDDKIQNYVNHKPSYIVYNG